MNTFTLRPLCSEVGSIGHLVTAFLTSESIVHNFLLSKVASPTYRNMWNRHHLVLAMSYLYVNMMLDSQHRATKKY